MQPSIGSDDNQKMKKRKNIAPSAEMAGKQLHAIVPKKNVSDGDDDDRQQPEASLHRPYMNYVAIVWEIWV